VRRERSSSVLEQSVSVKVVAAINSMNKQGHYARIFRHQDKTWVEIDQCMLASFEQIEELVDGVHSFEELADLFKKRHGEELDGL
jgi:septation ring formation regulator EzrA